MGLDDGNLAGWHRDPSGRHELRFWDGDAWTEHVVDEGIPGLDYPTRSGRPPEGAKVTPVPTIEPPGAAEDPASGAESPEPATAEATNADTTTDAAVSEPEPSSAADQPVALETGEAAAAAVESEPVTVPTAADHTEITHDEPTVDLIAESEIDVAAEAADEAAATAAAAGLDEAVESSEPAVIHTPLVASASVLAPGREVGVDPGPSPHPTPTPTPTPAPSSGRSLRSRRGGEPPVPAVPPSPEREPVAPTAASDATSSDSGLTAERSVEDPQSDIAAAEPSAPSAPVVGVPMRLIAEAPTVASPAGNSAGSNTSAIADPHRHTVPTAVPNAPDATGPRVTGASPVPVKRYRPGSPPASPHAGPRALPAATTEVVGTIVAPWYRRASSWLAILAVGVVAALVVVIVGMASDDTTTNRIGGRPPAAAPQGHKVIDGDGFGIAAPAGWIVATDPGNTFPQLRRANWATPLTATDTGTGEAVLVVQLRHLAHQPQVDPELFWTDQVKDSGQRDTVTAGAPLSVHGFRANEITAAGPSGKPLVAASIDTGDRTFLVAVTAATAADAQTEFDRLIQTFDAR